MYTNLFVINFIEKVAIAGKFSFTKNHVLENYTLVKFESWGKGHIDAKTNFRNKAI